MNKKRVLVILIVTMMIVLGTICFASANSTNITEVNSLGETIFTIPAGETTAYLVFDSKEQTPGTYSGKLTGVTSKVTYSFAGGYAPYIENGTQLKESGFYAKSGKVFESDGTLYFTAYGDNLNGNRRTILRFELTEPQTKDATLSLTIDEHTHKFTVNKDAAVNSEKHSVLTSEYGSCECGYAYRIDIQASCAGYRTGSGSSIFDAYVPIENLYMYDGTGTGFDAGDNGERYVKKVRTNTESIGSFIGKYTISDSEIAAYFGGADHEYRYEVMNRIVVNVPTDKRTYTYTGKSIAPQFTVEPENCSPKEGIDYTVTLNGKTELKMLKVGSYTLAAKAEGDYYINRGKSTTLKVVPKKASIGITTGKGKVTVKFSTPVSSTGGDKYQIRYRRVGTETWKTLKTERQTKAVRNLTKGKRYEIQARAIKTIDGTTYYGSWSTMKTSTKVK